MKTPQFQESERLENRAGVFLIRARKKAAKKKQYLKSQLPSLSKNNNITLVLEWVQSADLFLRVNFNFGQNEFGTRGIRFLNGRRAFADRRIFKIEIARHRAE